MASMLQQVTRNSWMTILGVFDNAVLPALDFKSIAGLSFEK